MGTCFVPDFEVDHDHAGKIVCMGLSSMNKSPMEISKTAYDKIAAKN